MAYRFVNPYNFIDSGTKCAEVKSQEIGEKKYTGVIRYSLRTVTPLFIPNTSNENAFMMKKVDDQDLKEHKSYDFFSYKDLSEVNKSVKEDLPVPVIPGSEIRGMLRSNYEILTNSCMSAVDDDTLLSKRTQDKYKAGLLERRVKADGKAEYRLLKVRDDALLRTEGENSLKIENGCWDAEGRTSRAEWGRKCYVQKSLPEGSRVGVRLTIRDRCKPLVAEMSRMTKDTDLKGRKEGYLLKGEVGPEMKDSRNPGMYTKQNKHCAHVFCVPADSNKARELINNEEWFDETFLDQKLGAILKITDANVPGSYKEYSAELKKFRNGETNTYFPVYYSVIKYEGGKESLMLSPACITREIYTKKLSDMSFSHKSCEKSGKLCPACALFGTFRENRKLKSVTSRVRVSDLVCEEKDLNKCFKKEPVTIQPLSTPKFNPEFYMKKPAQNAVFWTYEYYVDEKGKIHENTAGVNGRKFYWHHPDFQMEKCLDKPNGQNKTIRPLNQGIQFTGKIYFEGLSEKELNTLCYLIDAGDKAELIDKKHGYKLGAAKPLGFGSIAMHVDEVLTRSIEKNIQEGNIAWKENPYESDEENTLIDKDILEFYGKMTDFNILKGKNISYPRTKEDGDIFTWFAENHTGYVFNKRFGENKESKMPPSRENMLFREYLQPMTPETVRVDLSKILSNGTGNGFGKKNFNQNGGNNQNRPFKPNKPWNNKGGKKY